MPFSKIIRNLVYLSLVIATALKTSFAEQHHDDQLEAVRQALLNEALSGQVEIISNGDVDEEGTLHESAYIQSRKRIRGVRIAEYATSMDRDSDVAGIRRKADITEDESCESARYLRKVAVESEMIANNNKKIGSIALGVVRNNAFNYLVYRLSNE